MPINIPDNMIISNVKIKHNIPNLYNESINMNVSSKDRGIHRLEGSFDITTNSNKSKRAIEAFIMRLKGRSGTFYIDLTDRFKPINSTRLLINVQHAIGDNYLNADLQYGEVTAGDFFNVPNDQKTYMFLEDKNSNGFIDIYPPLHKNITLNTLIDLDITKITARLNSDIQEFNYNESGLIHKYTLNWIEAL